jgi:hypothetical protein
MPAVLYFVRELVGNEGMAGAPLLHFAAVVNGSTGVINGHATITQAIAPPEPEM